MSNIYDYLNEEAEQRLIVVLGEKSIDFCWAGQRVTLRRSKAALYLVELLMHPYQSISALGLFALYNHQPPLLREASQTGIDLGAGESAFWTLFPEIDPHTLRDVKQRLNLIILQLAEAEENNDLGRAAALRTERDSLLEYLKDAYAFGNPVSGRHTQGFRCERNVYHMLNYILDVLTTKCEPLGQILRGSLRLWGELIFTPRDNLSVLVLEDRD